MIAIGEKQFETRSWLTNYRGKIAIHAAKKVDTEMCETEPIRSILTQHGYKVDNLPMGSVVAIATLADCLLVKETNDKEKVAYLSALGRVTEVRGIEYDFGWYEAGRYAWEMTDRKQIDPVPAKGYQRLWEWYNNSVGGVGL